MDIGVSQKAMDRVFKGSKYDTPIIVVGKKWEGKTYLPKGEVEKIKKTEELKSLRTRTIYSCMGLLKCLEEQEELEGTVKHLDEKELRCWSDGEKTIWSEKDRKIIDKENKINIISKEQIEKIAEWTWDYNARIVNSMEKPNKKTKFIPYKEVWEGGKEGIREQAIEMCKFAGLKVEGKK